LGHRYIFPSDVFVQQRETRNQRLAVKPPRVPEGHHLTGPVHPAYNPSFSACFFSWNSIFLSQQISQQCFSAGL
jgi:hypothetical protein